jgi:polysaccharide biosynthesis/export protein
MNSLVSVVFLAAVLGQDPQAPAPVPPAPAVQTTPAATGGPVDSEDRLRSTYLLGPDDQVAIRILDMDEVQDKPYRIDMRGNIRLPLVGRIHAAGLTVERLEIAIAESYKTYVQDPDVTVAVVEFRSQPVSVLGAVNTPGVLQLQGRKTLFEILSQAGGLRPDAGNRIKLTRRKEWGAIPLPDAKDDASGQFSIAEVSVKSVMDAKNPAENILVQPNDVISVPRAELVYVIGSVKRSGGFVLNEQEQISVLQALALAEGMDRTAAPKNARILRAALNSGDRTEVPVDIRGILAGTAHDVSMQANDILFIPNSAAKNATLRGVEAAIQVATGLVIWRR